MFCLHKNTKEEVKKALEQAYRSQNIIRIWYGNSKTGISWNEEFDVVGRIGRSTGQTQIPLLIHSTKSLGGPSLLEHYIVRIDCIKTKTTLYRHENFKVELYLRPDSVTKYHGAVEGFPIEVENQEKQVHARFKTLAKANRWLDFVHGRRYNK